MNKFKHWITNGTGKPFYARKVINLKEKPKFAEALVCGLGQFQFYINGQKVSDHVLDPAWTDYDKVIYYLRFDITEYLQEGANVLAAEVGNGWYAADQEYGYFFHFPSFMPPNPNPYTPFGDALVLAVHAEITGADGTITFIDTDSTWKTADHIITHTNCFGSESADGRKRISGWNDLTPENSRWKKALISENGEKLSGLAQEQTIPAVKVIKTYSGSYMKTVGGTSVYDFGQNVSGMLEFEVKGKKNTEIHVYPAEKLLTNGAVDQTAKNWLPIDVCESYIIAEDDQWEPFSMTFTYIGCRYIAVDCDPEYIRNIKLNAISSAGKNVGTFTCDDKRFMQIYDLVEKAVEANMVSVHTDCPTIERFAWQEENHLMAPSIMYMKQVKLHWEKFLKDARLAQHTADDWFHDMHHGRYYPGEGLIPAQAPCYIPNVLPVPGLGDFYNVIGWGSSIIIGTYWHYLFYGDEQIIRDNYNAGKKYLEFLKTNITQDGFINNGLGDWGNPTGEYAKENVETAFLFADAKILEKFAEILGETADKIAFGAFADQIRENYNEKLLVMNPDTGLYCYRLWNKDEEIFTTQAALAMPLYWGLVPDDKIQDVVESFRIVLKAAGSLKAGEVSQPYIIQTMARYGMNDLLCRMILNPEHPSYYAFVLEGETTLGEYWEKNPRSHCHDMMGHIIEWYYNGIAGICPVEPGFKKVLIKPYLPESVNYVKCTYHSISGPITVVMNRKDGKISLDVQAADGIQTVIDDTNIR